MVPSFKRFTIGVKEMKNKTILIVDDDEDDQFLLTEYFAEIGVKENINCVLDGALALEFLEKSFDCLPSLIILDVNMPKMNGIQVLEKIKEKYDIPVVMFSTCYSVDIAKKAKEMGALECIKKPTDENALKAVKSSMLELLKKIQS
jgi:CheY-like chemotaxis protein